MIHIQKMGWYALLILTLLLACGTFLSTASAALEKNGLLDQEYRLGVFPYLSPRELETVYAPVAENFSLAIGHPMNFMTSSSYQVFMDNLDKELYDVVFVQPFDYVAIADKYGYVPLATRNKPLPAILVVGPDSKIESIADLRGKTVALPPSVAAISYLIKNYLEENGLRPGRDVKIDHHRSHASCMKNVVLKVVDACGTAPPALRFFQAKMKTTLKVIVKTKGIPNSIFAVHPRVPELLRQKIIEQIASWPMTDTGKKILTGTKVERFVVAKDSDYDIVRTLAQKYR